MSCRSSSAAGLHFTLIQEFRSAIFAPSALSLKKRRATPIKVNCFLVNWWKRMKKERLKLSLLGQKHITAKRMPQCKRFIFWWRQQQTIHFNLISSFKQRKVNFLFIEFSNDWRELMNEIKRYYNSMLKVISWYKLNHKWKTTWIWWKLAGMIGDEFMKWDDF